jgi:general secretion pathway protein J
MRPRGFTLIELLVALAIFAVLSLLAYGGLASVLDGSELTMQRSTRLGALQATVGRLVDDLEQAGPRPVRDAYGDPLPALSGGGGAAVFELTRGGWPNPAGQPRSSLQRVAYELVDRTLVRRVWVVLDRAPDSAPLEQRLLTGVDAFELRFRGSRDGRWEASWPPAGAAAGSEALPLAIEATLEVEGFGRITRLVVAGG